MAVEVIALGVVAESIKKAAAIICMRS